MSDQPRQQCAAITRKGTRCKNFALPNSDFCRLHQPNPAADAPPKSPSADDLRAQLIEELDALADRIRAISPNYSPPPFSVRGTAKLVSRTLRAVVGKRPRLLSRLQNAVGSDLLDVDTWKGVWYMLNYTLEYQRDFLKRRITGEYETDEWGMDWEFAQAVQPFFDFLYKMYWRIETDGVENIPEDGRALLVGDAAGQYPWIGAMVATAVATEHPDMRQVRSLYNTTFAGVPFFSIIFDKTGQAPANIKNGEKLLAQDEVVAVYPTDESDSGISWLDAARLANSTGAPIVPVAIVGVAGTDTAARVAAGDAALPASFAPWMSVLGQLPIPVQWTIAFGSPITDFPADTAGSEVAATLTLAGEIKDAIAALRKQHLPQ